jgi:succinate-acetate transporter protein
MVQFAAGMWEFAVGNTFGATALSSYGGFWLSYAVILIPGFNVGAGYPTDNTDFQTAIAFYLFGWAIFTFLLLLATFRHSIAFIFLFFTLDLAFWSLAISSYIGSSGWQKAGGVFGLLAAFAAWYCALAQLLTKDNSYFTVPLVSLQKKAI